MLNCSNLKISALFLATTAGAVGGELPSLASNLPPRTLDFTSKRLPVIVTKLDPSANDVRIENSIRVVNHNSTGGYSTNLSAAIDNLKQLDNEMLKLRTRMLHTNRIALADYPVEVQGFLKKINTSTKIISTEMATLLADYSPDSIWHNSIGINVQRGTNWIARLDRLTTFENPEKDLFTQERASQIQYAMGSLIRILAPQPSRGQNNELIANE
jgi:hypothetical protein